MQFCMEQLFFPCSVFVFLVYCGLVLLGLELYATRPGEKGMGEMGEGRGG